MKRSCFSIVLVEPEIPPNTGNVARLCAATATTLHLVKPLGFSLDDRHLRRAGLDYWHAVDVRVWESLDELLAAHPASRPVVTSKRGTIPFHHFRYLPGDLLVFGRESAGLPQELIDRYPQQNIRIPIRDPVRSLNLSTAAGIVLYEALRSIGHLDGGVD